MMARSTMIRSTRFSRWAFISVALGWIGLSARYPLDSWMQLQYDTVYTGLLHNTALHFHSALAFVAPNSSLLNPFFIMGAG